MCKLHLLVLLSWFLVNVGYAQDTNLLLLKGQKPYIVSGSSVLKDNVNNKHSLNYPPASRDFKRLANNTFIYFGTSLLVFGVMALLPEDYSSWKKSEIRIPTLLTKWSENVKTGPVDDNDNFFINSFAHPYCGAVYYMTARSSGFNNCESFLYSAVMSTVFWEYGVEAFAEIPSRQDLLITPVMGALFGEIFFNVKKIILRHDKRILGSRFLATATLLFLDPFNTILDGAGYKGK